MSKSIPLHPEHGLNPTIPVCFYCGKERNEIAFLGAKFKGEAPKHMVIDIAPCDECKAKYTDYTLLVEAEPDRSGRSRSKKSPPPQPTGRWCAIRKECLNIPPTPIAYVDIQTMNELLSKATQDSP